MSKTILVVDVSSPGKTVVCRIKRDCDREWAGSAG